MEKLFYSIGEVSELLQVNTSAVRYWTNEFSKFLKPKRNAKGNQLDVVQKLTDKYDYFD